MKNSVFLLCHILTTIAKLLRPNGFRSVVAENILLKHQLSVLNRSNKRAPKLTGMDRFIFGWCTLFLSPNRILKSAIILKPSTLLKYHKALIQKKYIALFSSSYKRKSGPKGPSQELINAVIEMKQRNPRFGCPRIAQQVNLAFGLNIEKDVVRRILEKHYKPTSGDNGPSWLTFLSHAKDSLWSVYFFRSESPTLKSHWVMLVMDVAYSKYAYRISFVLGGPQFTRRIVGFSVHRGDLNGAIACRMFNAILSKQEQPTRLSSDNNPIFQYHRWKSNLRILNIEEVKSIPLIRRYLILLLNDLSVLFAGDYLTKRCSGMGMI